MRSSRCRGRSLGRRNSQVGIGKRQTTDPGWRRNKPHRKSAPDRIVLYGCVCKLGSIKCLLFTRGQESASTFEKSPVLTDGLTDLTYVEQTPKNQSTRSNRPVRMDAQAQHLRFGRKKENRQITRSNFKNPFWSLRYTRSDSNELCSGQKKEIKGDAKPSSSWGRQNWV